MIILIINSNKYLSSVYFSVVPMFDTITYNITDSSFSNVIYTTGYYYSVFSDLSLLKQ